MYPSRIPRGCCPVDFPFANLPKIANPKEPSPTRNLSLYPRLGQGEAPHRRRRPGKRRKKRQRFAYVYTTTTAKNMYPLECTLENINIKRKAIPRAGAPRKSQTASAVSQTWSVATHFFFMITLIRQDVEPRSCVMIYTL